MKTRKDVIEHAAVETGVERAEVRRVLDAAFSYLRSSLLAGSPVNYPGMGKIRVKTRTDPDGTTKTVYRLEPDEDGAGPAKAGRKRPGGVGPIGGDAA